MNTHRTTRFVLLPSATRLGRRNAGRDSPCATFPQLQFFFLHRDCLVYKLTIVRVLLRHGVNVRPERVAYYQTCLGALGVRFNPISLRHVLDILTLSTGSLRDNVTCMAIQCRHDGCDHEDSSRSRHSWQFSVVDTCLSQCLRQTPHQQSVNSRTRPEYKRNELLM